MSPPSRLFSLHYGVTVRKEYLTGIETSRVKTFKENNRLDSELQMEQLFEKTLQILVQYQFIILL